VIHTTVSSGGLTTTTGSNTYDTLASYSMPAGTLATNGDTLEIFAMFSVIADGLGLQLFFDGNVISPSAYDYNLYCTIRITRISNTVVMVEQTASPSGGLITGLNLTSNAYTIAIKVSDLTTGTALLHAFNVLLYRV
jgi:hypothetical protein